MSYTVTETVTAIEPTGIAIPSVGQALTLHGPLANDKNVNDILSLKTFDLEEPSLSQVLIKFLAAPINPIDIHVLAGRYPVKPRHKIDSSPIPGFDGVARVLKVGNAVENLREGHLVIPKTYGLGTWRTHAVVEANDLIRVRSRANILFAAMIKTVVLPAYLLVEDMKSLEKDDWIVQNAGTSAIAQAVAQFAKLKGAHTLSVIRDRPTTTTATSITHADMTIEEKDFDPKSILQSNNKKFVLALDSVWGPSAERITTLLSPNANSIFVNYGQFNGGGPESTIPLFHRDIFMKGITFRPFRTTAQAAERSERDMNDLFAWFVDLFEARQLKLPLCREVSWDDGNSVLKAVDDVMKMDGNSVGTGKRVIVFT